MFLAICYREASPQKLEALKEEMQKDGKVQGEVAEMFTAMEQPNPEIPSEPIKKHNCTEPWYGIQPPTK